MAINYQFDVLLYFDHSNTIHWIELLPHSSIEIGQTLFPRSYIRRPNRIIVPFLGLFQSGYPYPNKKKYEANRIYPFRHCSLIMSQFASMIYLSKYAFASTSITELLRTCQTQPASRCSTSSMTSRFHSINPTTNLKPQTQCKAKNHICRYATYKA